MTQLGLDPVYPDLTEPDNKVPVNVLRAFVHTNKAFKWIMNQVNAQMGDIKEYENTIDAPTVLDIPTYRQLPDEFLGITDEEKTKFINKLLEQHTGVEIDNQDEYIKNLYHESLERISRDLRVEIPKFFDTFQINSLQGLITFMGLSFPKTSIKEKLFHCALLKLMFVVFIVDSSVDIKNIPRITLDIKEKITKHERISQISWDDESNKLIIGYTPPKKKKPKYATIKFGEKSKKAILEKLLRKPDFRGPEVISDLGRLSVVFHEMDGASDDRAWLLGEIGGIVFGPYYAWNIETNTLPKRDPVVSQEATKKIQSGKGKEGVEKGIPGVHNLQMTSRINPKLPDVKGVHNYEVMGEFMPLDFNKNGEGDRNIYNMERLQKAFSRLTTGGYGVLKPGQVKYALEQYGSELGTQKSAIELFRLLVFEKKFLIPVKVRNDDKICYRVRGIYDRNGLVKDLFDVQIEDIEFPSDEQQFIKLQHKLEREFSRSRGGHKTRSKPLSAYPTTHRTYTKTK